ncbi:MAG: hypothetical protein LBT68_01075 [Spirochaetales bacterium]|nr:hypothetical protein [Spirochaetales bacterium]
MTGAILAILRFWVPVFVKAEGFGASRYISAFVDFTSLPVLLPLIIAFVLTKVRPDTRINDFIGFTLLAMAPPALVASTFWSARAEMLRLVLTPLLQASLAISFYPLLYLWKKPKIPPKILAVSGMAVFPLLAAFVWWKFFCQETLTAVLSLIPAAAPMLICCFALFRKRKKAGGETTFVYAEKTMSFMLKVFFPLKKGRNSALAGLALLSIIALANYRTAGLSRRTFVFYEIGSGKPRIEERMIARTSSREIDIPRYVEDALLGPLSMQTAPLVDKAAELDSLLLREGAVFLNLSEGAAIPVGDGRLLFDNFLTLNLGIRRNFHYVEEVYIFISGNEVYFSEFSEKFADINKESSFTR